MNEVEQYEFDRQGYIVTENIATMDEPQHIASDTLARYTKEQRNLFRLWPEK